MKKILITMLMIASASGSNANANENLKFHDNGASLKLADLDTGGINKDMLGISVLNTGPAKRNALIQNRTTGSALMGSETELGFSYDHPVNKKLNSNIKLLYRNDANNMLGASDGAAMFRLNYKFN